MLSFILNEPVFASTFRLLLYVGDNNNTGAFFFFSFFFFFNQPSKRQEILHFMVRSGQQKNSAFTFFVLIWVYRPSDPGIRGLVFSPYYILLL